MHRSHAASARPRFVLLSGVLLVWILADGRAHGRLAGARQQGAQADIVWCPMHPDVRAAKPGKCPICSMDLVPIPPPRVGEYRLEIAQTRKDRGRGLALRVIDPSSGAPVQAFNEVHDRLFHLFVISRDLRRFAHEHPRRTLDGFEVDLDLRPGAYMLIADFQPSAGTPQLIHQALITPGYSGSPFYAASDLRDDLAPKTVDGIRIEMTLQRPSAGREIVARFTALDGRTRAPITDLEPFLGAPGHLLVVSADLTQAIHAHPDSAVTGGPDITFPVRFPSPGLFKLWVQVQRAGKVVTAPFVVRVDP
jgi:hypothetical protein